MAWRIQTWDAKARVGEVVSPHFGPLAFGEEQNPHATHDFEVGEEVLVELDGPKDAYVVRTVVATHQRQPPGTTCAQLEESGGSRASDMRLDVFEPSRLQFWLGECCDWCSRGRVVTFEGVHRYTLDDETDLDNVLVRLASEDEKVDLGGVPEGSEAYCIVTDHGNGRDGPRYFIVAEGFSVTATIPPSAAAKPHGPRN